MQVVWNSMKDLGISLSPSSTAELFIRIVPDKVNKTLSIIDSGVGMTKSGIAVSVPCDVYVILMTISSVGNPLPPTSLPMKHHSLARIACGLLNFDFF
ncbi:hypothetical protein RHSIM_Rhsim05G0138500 [Rhododendron simsii]|uniref:Uncharacterized protein n=1 Tax=Rhododendron simsii TaxID=118357 RepID=A0A834GV31_RHOSS|nr:hypothetical protein RHSIM_Rhsim05G0138500 [Rhododendron simsii]